MSRAWTLAAAAMALALPGAVQAAQSNAPAAAAAVDSKLAAARRIVELTNPRARMFEANMVGWESAARKSLSLDAASVKLDTAYPGLFDAVIAGARPMASDYLGNFVNRMLDHKAQVLVQRLSAKEMDQVLAFFSSGPGQKAVRGLFANLDAAKLGTDAAVRGAKTGSAAYTPQEVQRIEREAISKMAGAATADELTAMMRFSQSAAGGKFSSAMRDADVQILAMVNNPDPAWMERQQNVMRDAAVAFIASRRK